MATERNHDLRSVLERAQTRRAELGLPSQDTQVYRLLNATADGLPDLTVDVYGRFVVLSELAERSEAELEQVLDGLVDLGVEGVYLKRRPRQANVLSDEERRARTPAHAVRGRDAPEELVVFESGMPFLVRLGDGLSTGLFLDQRANRAELRARAAGKRVLNLFAYTCAFGCAAALGGALSTTNIDVSKAVLERGQRNYQNAGVWGPSHTFLARDVLESLPKLLRREERFDLVVLDPPSFASTKNRRFTVERDYAELASQALLLLEDGGALLACTNLHSLGTSAFTRMLQSAAARAKRGVEIVVPPSPVDFPAPSGGDPHLKSAWVGLR